MTLIIVCITLITAYGIYVLSKPHDCEKHGHSFQPRYHQEPCNSLGLERINGYVMVHEAGLVESMTTKTTYVCDVCQYCGKTVRLPAYSFSEKKEA